jgi:hypothetical protein
MGTRRWIRCPIIGGPNPGRPSDATGIAVHVPQDPCADVIAEDVQGQGRLHVLG